MGERTKVILNEYSAKDLLKRDTLDLDKFYTADLKLFVEVARKEIKEQELKIEEMRKELINQDEYITKLKEEYAKQLQQKENIIKEAREYIEMHTPSDIGICGNSTKRYYTLGEDSVDHILEILDKENKQ